MSDSIPIPVPRSNEVAGMGFMKMIGLKKHLKPPMQDALEESSDIVKKTKVSF